MKTPKIINTKRGPERIIQDDIIKLLTLKGWFVKETHGNMFQSGFPDLWACKRTCGSRWIEVKHPTQYCFTPAQIKDFHRMAAEGIGIWILSAATESEYNKLFGQPNWHTYLQVYKC